MKTLAFIMFCFCCCLLIGLMLAQESQDKNLIKQHNAPRQYTPTDTPRKRPKDTLRVIYT